MARVLTTVKQHPWRTALGLAVVVLAAGAFMSRDLIGLVLSPDDPVDSTLPLAPGLQARSGETVYRIDAERSTATVAVKEKLAGVSQDVELTTRAITGDLGVPAGDLSQARIGEVAVDVHQLQSDNALRDKAIRHQFLESHDHPVVRLTDARVEGLTGPVPAGKAVPFRITGNLQVKGTAHPVTFDATARTDGTELTATATSKLKMSDLGVGPITKAGLVSTSDDMKLTLKVVAVDGRSFTPPAQLAVTDQKVRTTSGRGPSFSKRVGPLLATSCASCHEPGAAGAASWTLRTAGDAADVADGLAVVTTSKYMPPWPASHVGVPLKHDRSLSAADIAMLKDWATAGAPLDVPRSTKVKPSAHSGVPLPRADVTMTLTEPYQGSPAKKDDYRCFVMDPKVTAPTFMTGYLFTPDQTAVVHHALVYRQRAATRADVDARDAADPGSGFDCVAGVGAGSRSGDLVAGWVPGQVPINFTQGDGFDLQPGDYLVAQIHYHYEKSNPPDRSKLSLQLAKDPTGITALQTRVLYGPVELPCPADVSGPLCDRNAALADAQVRFGPAGRITPDALHRLCRTTPEQVAAQSDGHTAHTSCDYRIGRSGQIIDVLGHMHNLGQSYRMTLNPGQPDQKVLLDIPTWNFAWQLNYQPVDEVQVKPGDTIRTECTWNRDLRFDPVPRYIFFAEGTNDEMCFATYTLRPDKQPQS
jgi:polyisoprenoid-binding protein YceI